MHEEQPVSGGLMSSMRERLNNCIEDLYRAFSHRKLPSKGLQLCTQCCTDQDHIDRLRRTPLRELTRHDLWLYYFSVNYGTSVEEEVAHFLPRIMEFVAKGDSVTNNGFEAIFIGCSHNGLPKLDDEERRSLIAFFDAMLCATLMAEHDFDDYVSTMEVLDMYVASGIGPQPALDILIDPPKEAEPTALLFIYGDLLQLAAPDSGRTRCFVDMTPHQPAFLAAVTSPQMLSFFEDMALSDYANEWDAKDASDAHLIATHLLTQQ